MHATGGIYSAGGGSLTLLGSALFDANVAVADGGAISITELDEIIMVGPTFTSNMAERGGAIYARYAQDSIRVYDYCTFEDNEAEDGGALYLKGSAGRDLVDTAVFRGNHARKEEPVVYVAPSYR